MKNLIKKIFIIFCTLSALVIIISMSYMLYIYIDFVANKDSIFKKINTFSKALTKSNEIEITLGQNTIEDQKATYFLDTNGEIITQYSSQKHKLIPLRRIPFFVSHGFLLIEDSHFYKHNGINFVRLTYGIINNLIAFGRAPGGSTVSQQLAKILFTSQKKTLRRKVYELYCTFELEKNFSKNEILQIYLNSIYLGHGIYGIANASQFYFGKNASELNIAEASLFIGMNRAPEYYSPIKYRKNAERIQKTILAQFIKEGYLSKEESNMEIARFWKDFDQFGRLGNQSFWKTKINRSGYVTEYIRQILATEISQKKITQGGLRVETTIDLKKQMLAERIVKEQLKYIQKKIINKLKEKKTSNEKIKEIKKLEAAFASIDYKKGEILTLVGGSGFSFANQLNRAAYSYRPIGSAVKPFIYSIALNNRKIGENRIHPFSKFKDDLVTYKINGINYQPKNYYNDHQYGNLVTLYDALKRSLNTVSVAIFNQMDKKEVTDFIKKAAFLRSEKDKKRVPNVLSLALGTCELSTLELATAYSVFCKNGAIKYPIIIKKISDAKGYVYYDHNRKNNPYFNDLLPSNYGESIPLIHPETAYEMAQMMKSIFEKNGTGTWPAYVTNLHIPAYAKSGTTQNYKDGWFAGFTNSEVSAAWVGLDNNKSILLPGASTAGIIWCDYNNRVSSKTSAPILKPKNMKLLSICTDTGLISETRCKNIKSFYFWKDSPIPEKCYIHQKEINEDFIELK